MSQYQSDWHGDAEKFPAGNIGSAVALSHTPLLNWVWCLAGLVQNLMFSQPACGARKTAGTHLKSWGSRCLFRHIQKGKMTPAFVKLEGLS